jgi:GntR family transcriptional regulator
VPRIHRYEEIANDLAERIAAGEFTTAGAPPARRRAGQLPSRSVLTVEYEATEPTIDKAMLVLRTRGLVESLQGVGVFVKDPDPR